MKRLKEFVYSFISRNFVMYSLIGTINTLDTAIFSALLAFVLDEHISSYLGFVLSLSVGYILNAKINFKHRLAFSEYLKFMASYVPNFLIYIAISTIAISVWDWPPFWATVTAALAGVPVTYALMRFYAFGNKNNEQKCNCDKDRT